MSIFGVTLFGRAFSAVAKDIPKASPKPTALSASPLPSKEIIKGISGAAVSTSSFIIGGAEGLIVVIGIVKVQGK